MATYHTMEDLIKKLNENTNKNEHKNNTNPDITPLNAAPNSQLYTHGRMNFYTTALVARINTRLNNLNATSRTIQITNFDTFEPNTDSRTSNMTAGQSIGVHAANVATGPWANTVGGILTKNNAVGHYTLIMYRSNNSVGERDFVSWRRYSPNSTPRWGVWNYPSWSDHNHNINNLTNSLAHNSARLANNIIPGRSQMQPAGTNFNNLTTPGFYHFTANASTDAMPNRAIGEAGYLQVYIHGANRGANVTQEFTGFSSRRKFIRSQTGTNEDWSTWREITTNDASTLTAGFLPNDRIQANAINNARLADGAVNWAQTHADFRPNANPPALGAANLQGTVNRFARQDHSHPMPTATNVGAMPITGGTFTGNVTFGANNTIIQNNHHINVVTGNAVINLDNLHFGNGFRSGRWHRINAAAHNPVTGAPNNATQQFWMELIPIRSLSQTDYVQDQIYRDSAGNKWHRRVTNGTWGGWTQITANQGRDILATRINGTLTSAQLPHITIGTGNGQVNARPASWNPTQLNRVSGVEPTNTIADHTFQFFTHIANASTTLPGGDNANAILHINRHSGFHDTQLGFTNSSMFWRNATSAGQLTTNNWINMRDAAWMNSGRLTTARLPLSGVTAGTSGPATNASPGFGGSFTVPDFTVNAEGQVTARNNRTITLPATPTTITGNAGTATRLQTARTINGVLFDGSQNIETVIHVTNAQQHNANNWSWAGGFTTGVWCATTGTRASTTSNIPSQSTGFWLELRTIRQTTNVIQEQIFYGHGHNRWRRVSSGANGATWSAWTQIWSGNDLLANRISGVLASGNIPHITIGSGNGQVNARPGDWMPTAQQTGAMIARAANVTTSAVGNGTMHQDFRINGSIGNSTNDGFPGSLGATLSWIATTRGAQLWASNGGESTTGNLWYRSGDINNGLAGAWVNMRDAGWITGGRFATARLPVSGVTAGTSGPTANASPGFGGTFTVPDFTVNAEGQVTARNNRTITLPATPTTVTGNAGHIAGTVVNSGDVFNANSLFTNNVRLSYHTINHGTSSNMAASGWQSVLTMQHTVSVGAQISITRGVNSDMWVRNIAGIGVETVTPWVRMARVNETVQLTGNQSVAGTKTFTGRIIASGGLTHTGRFIYTGSIFRMDIGTAVDRVQFGQANGQGLGIGGQWAIDHNGVLLARALPTNIPSANIGTGNLNLGGPGRLDVGEIRFGRNTTFGAMFIRGQSRHGNSNQGEMIIQSGGAMFIGSGEGPQNLANNLNLPDNTERVFLVGDQAVEIVVGAQNTSATAASHRIITFTNQGHLENVNNISATGNITATGNVRTNGVIQLNSTTETIGRTGGGNIDINQGGTWRLSVRASDTSNASGGGNGIVGVNGVFDAAGRIFSNRGQTGGVVLDNVGSNGTIRPRHNNLILQDNAGATRVNVSTAGINVIGSIMENGTGVSLVDHTHNDLPLRRFRFGAQGTNTGNWFRIANVRETGNNSRTNLTLYIHVTEQAGATSGILEITTRVGNPATTGIQVSAHWSALHGFNPEDFRVRHEIVDGGTNYELWAQRTGTWQTMTCNVITNLRNDSLTQMNAWTVHDRPTGVAAITVGGTVVNSIAQINANRLIGTLPSHNHIHADLPQIAGIPTGAQGGNGTANNNIAVNTSFTISVPRLQVNDRGVVTSLTSNAFIIPRIPNTAAQVNARPDTWLPTEAETGNLTFTGQGSSGAVGGDQFTGASANLNDLIRPGVYVQNTHASVNTWVNRPPAPTGLSATVIVTRIGADSAGAAMHQTVIFSRESGAVSHELQRWERTSNRGANRTWNAWERIATHRDLENVSGIATSLTTVRTNWLAHTNAALGTVAEGVAGTTAGNGFVVGSGNTGDAVAITLARNSTTNGWTRMVNEGGIFNIQRKLGSDTTWTNMISIGGTSHNNVNFFGQVVLPGAEGTGNGLRTGNLQANGNQLVLRSNDGTERLRIANAQATITGPVNMNGTITFTNTNNNALRARVGGNLDILDAGGTWRLSVRNAASGNNGNVGVNGHFNATGWGHFNGGLWTAQGRVPAQQEMASGWANGRGWVRTGRMMSEWFSIVVPGGTAGARRNIAVTWGTLTQGPGVIAGAVADNPFGVHTAAGVLAGGGTAASVGERGSSGCTVNGVRMNTVGFTMSVLLNGRCSAVNPLQLEEDMQDPIVRQNYINYCRTVDDYYNPKRFLVERSYSAPEEKHENSDEVFVDRYGNYIPIKDGELVLDGFLEIANLMKETKRFNFCHEACCAMEDYCYEQDVQRAKRIRAEFEHGKENIERAMKIESESEKLREEVAELKKLVKQLLEKGD